MRLMTLYDFYQQFGKRGEKTFSLIYYLFGEQKHFFPFRYMIFRFIFALYIFTAYIVPFKLTSRQIW